MYVISFVAYYFMLSLRPAMPTTNHGATPFNVAPPWGGRSAPDSTEKGASCASSPWHIEITSMCPNRSLGLLF